MYYDLNAGLAAAAVVSVNNSKILIKIIAELSSKVLFQISN